jgi:two-component system, cell cycle sensor histidine kinase and response regulator CckA
MKVLVVDDLYQNRYLLQVVFEAHGHEVHCFENGREALVWLAAARASGVAPDAIVTDLLMPETDGFELIRQVREHYAQTIAIVVYTATYTEPADQDLALRSGADTFVIKPIEPSELVQMAEDTWRARVRGARTATPPSDFAEVHGRRLLEKLRKRGEENARLGNALLSTERLRALACRVGELGPFSWRKDAGELSLSDEARRVLDASDDSDEGFGALRLEGAHVKMFTTLVDDLLRDEEAKDLSLSWSVTDELRGQRHLTAYLVRDPTCSDGVLGIVRDASAQQRLGLAVRRLESQVLQAQKLDSIGAMTAGLVHDLSNLLMMIVGNADELVATGTLDREASADLAHAAARACDLVTSVRRFLQASPLEPTTLSLAAIVREVVQLLRSSVPASVSLCAASPPVDRLVDGHASQLLQVVMNLVLNALHATKDAGDLVEVSILEGGAARPLGDVDANADWVVVEVHDNGAGMSAEVQSRVFEPFFTTKPGGKGTGLGLSTARSIVEAHGGLLTVESELGLGSRFRAHLPIACKLEDPATLGGRRVLLFDPSSASGPLVHHALQRCRIDCVLVTQAFDALERLAVDPRAFDVVLMADTSASSVVRKLAKDARVVALASVFDAVSKPAEVDALLRWPFSATALLAALRSERGP